MVFVTDDNKEDWWWKIELEGPKTIGPRPELVNEACLRGSIESFLMYNPEGFLKYAKEFLKAEVSEETLKEVREVSTAKNARSSSPIEIIEMSNRAQRAVHSWLANQFDTIQVNQSFPDFIIHRDGQKFGFEVKVVRSRHISMMLLRDTFYRAYYELNEGRFNGISIVFVANNYDEIEEHVSAIARFARERATNNLKIIIGVVEELEAGEPKFIPYSIFSHDAPSFRETQPKLDIFATSLEDANDENSEE